MNEQNDRPRHEILVALRVTDETGYQRYRDAMTPILHAMGGRFRYDFRVSEMLRGDADGPPNRVFILSFPDAATKERFFGAAAYQTVRAAHFVASAENASVIAEYDLA